MVTSTINRQKYTSYICSFGYVTTAAWKCPPCKKDAKIDTQKLQNTRENLKVCQLPTKHHNEQFNAVKFQSVSVKKSNFRWWSTRVDVGEKRVNNLYPHLLTHRTFTRWSWKDDKWIKLTWVELRWGAFNDSKCLIFSLSIFFPSLFDLQISRTWTGIIRCYKNQFSS